MEIREATRAEDIAIARELLREYERALGVDLCFQGFAQELANLPGEYASPRGTLLLAHVGNDVAGCIALRAVSDNICEMKRLYVRDAFRAGGLGRSLVERLISIARAMGYQRMVLDTLPTMVSAQRLYAGFGFADIAPYRHNPIGGTRFLGLELGASAPASRS